MVEGKAGSPICIVLSLLWNKSLNTIRRKTINSCSSGTRERSLQLKEGTVKTLYSWERGRNTSQAQTNKQVIVEQALRRSHFRDLGTECLPN